MARQSAAAAILDKVRSRERLDCHLLRSRWGIHGHRSLGITELIRILDYAAGFGYDIQGAFDEKMAFNARREDHKHEARRISGGKQF